MHTIFGTPYLCDFVFLHDLYHELFVSSSRAKCFCDHRLLSFSKAFGKALILLFPVAEEYIQVHDGYAKFRWPILAIVGATRWGKTRFAGHVFRRIGEQLSLLARLLGDHGGGL